MTTVFYLPEAPAHILQEHRHDGREEQEEDHEERQFPVFFSQCSTQLSGYPYYRKVESAGRSYEAHLYRQLSGLIGDGMDDIHDREEDGDEDGDDEEHDALDDEMRSKMEARKKKAGLHALLKEDYYELLGLGQVRWEATQDQIRRAYRKKALEHHPDKTGGHDDTMFKAVNKAFEVLSDERKKRAYDSMDAEFEDEVPNVSSMDPAKFFEVFGPIFQRWSKWSEYKPVPKLGGEKTEWHVVDRFYKFWTNFRSWRDFSYEDEYDINDAEHRDERRWMERQNERQRRKRKREEREKLVKLVTTAMRLDPRVQKQREKEEEERQKREKAKEERRMKRLREQEEKRAARLRREEEEERKAEEEKRRQREELLQRERRLNESKEKLRMLCRPHLLDLLDVRDRKDANGIKGEDIEYAMLRLNVDQLDDFNKRLEELKDEKDKLIKTFNQTVKKIRNMDKKRAEEEKKQKAGEAQASKSEWTREELSLLSKAASVFPGGTGQRWVRIAEYIGTRTPDEVRQKTAEMRQTNVIKRDLVNRDHFAEFQKKRAAAMAPAINPVEDWTNEQQKQLESGIRAHRALKGEAKWTEIAKMVDGKTSQDCKERFDYCKQLALQKRKIQQK